MTTLCESQPATRNEQPATRDFLLSLNHSIARTRATIKRLDEILSGPCPRRLADEISRQQSHHMLALAGLLDQRQRLLDRLDAQAESGQDDNPGDDPAERQAEDAFARRLAEDASEPGRDFGDL